MNGEGVREGRRFEVDVEAAIKVRRRLTVHEPPAVIASHSRPSRAGGGLAAHMRHPGTPAGSESNHVADCPGRIALDGGGVAAQVIAAINESEKHDFEATSSLPVRPCRGARWWVEAH